MTLSLLGLACGGGTTPSATPTHAHFQLILEQEAELEHHQRALEEPPGSCDGACEAAAGVCTAASRICEVAATMVDADGQTRCQRGQESCREAQASSDGRCGCEAEDGP